LAHLKDYRNPHLSSVWFEAQRVLRQADRLTFVGYSMPDDDVEVVYLVKRGLAHIQSPKLITVVEYCETTRASLWPITRWATLPDTIRRCGLVRCCPGQLVGRPTV